MNAWPFRPFEDIFPANENQLFQQMIKNAPNFILLPLVGGTYFLPMRSGEKEAIENLLRQLKK